MLDEAFVGFTKLYTHKNFFAFNKKPKKHQIYPQKNLIASEKSVENNNCKTIFQAYKTTCSVVKTHTYGNVVQIELVCEKCYNTRYYELDLEKLSGDNHWD